MQGRENRAILATALQRVNWRNGVRVSLMRPFSVTPGDWLAGRRLVPTRHGGQGLLVAVALPLALLHELNEL